MNISTMKTTGKKFLMALGVLALGLAGTNARALDSAGAAKSGKAYHTYSDSEVHDMLDAINRDYPVRFSGVSGSSFANISDDDATALVDAINRDRPVAAARTTANPYVAIDGDRAHELIALLNRADTPSYAYSIPAALPSAPVEYVQVASPAEVPTADSLAQSASSDING